MFSFFLSHVLTACTYVLSHLHPHPHSHSHTHTHTGQFLMPTDSLSLCVCLSLLSLSHSLCLSLSLSFFVSLSLSLSGQFLMPADCRACMAQLALADLPGTDSVLNQYLITARLTCLWLTPTHLLILTYILTYSPTPTHLLILTYSYSPTPTHLLILTYCTQLRTNTW